VRVVAGRVDVADVDAFVAWLGEVGTTHGCAVQGFDARYVADSAHLRSAVEHANRAFERGENVARDRRVEILLYAAGRRQIDQAVEMGVSTGERVPVVVVVDATPSAPGAEEAAAVAALEARVVVDDAVLGGARDESRIAAFFGVTDAERRAAATDLGGLVRERVALLDVEK
jgi:KEOPS complex subunit Cgi121